MEFTLNIDLEKDEIDFIIKYNSPKRVDRAISIDLESKDYKIYMQLADKCIVTNSYSWRDKKHFNFTSVGEEIIKQITNK